MSFRNAQPETLARRPNGWLRLASKAVRVTCGATAKQAPAPVGPPSSAGHPVVGVRKSAVCTDARGQLRRIDLFLPADLVAELSRPLDLKFLDGDEPVTADEIGKAIRLNFAGAEADPGAGQ